MDISVKNLFYWSYWFGQPYIARGTVLKIWVGGFLLLVLAGLLLRIWRQYQQDSVRREIIRRFSNIGLALGMLGLLWMFLRQERVPFLAWRFWLWLWLLGFVGWLFSVVKYAVKRAPAIRKVKAAMEAKEKYLP